MRHAWCLGTGIRSSLPISGAILGRDLDLTMIPYTVRTQDSFFHIASTPSTPGSEGGLLVEMSGWGKAINTTSIYHSIQTPPYQSPS